MPIQYCLVPNPNTPDPNDQYARVTTIANTTLDDLAGQIVREGHATSSEQAKAVLSAAMDIIARQVADGNAVNLPLMTIRPGLTGVFIDVNDSFDPSRHTLRTNLQSGPLLDAAMSTATPQKIQGGAPAPYLISFTDLNTGSVNGTITPGGMGQVLGSELKFDPAQNGAGLFVIAETNGAGQFVPVSMRTDGQLLFIIPGDLVAGAYALEARRVYGSGSLRSGRLGYSLTVPGGSAAARKNAGKATPATAAKPAKAVSAPKAAKPASAGKKARR